MQRYWWEHILTLPPSKEDNSYKRIERISIDKTRYGKNKNGRIHEISNPNHETNLTINVFENFTLFEDSNWLSQLLKRNGIQTSSEIQELNWSYEWEHRVGRQIKLLDVVINYKTKDENSILIIEAKNKNKILGDKDRDVDYYLNIDTFDVYDNKSLIFLVDEKTKARVKTQVKEAENIKVFTWQSMCLLQLDLIDSLNLNSNITMFIKSSIHKMFRQFGLATTSLTNTYIADEIPMDQMVELKFGTEEAQEKIWEIT